VGDPPDREELHRREELSNLYMRGVKEGYEGELIGRQAEAMRDILDVFGEDGLRVYLMGVIEGEEDAEVDEAAADPDAVEVIVNYETGEITPIERDEDEEDDDSENADRPDE
jgi:hypothetical protein